MTSRMKQDQGTNLSTQLRLLLRVSWNSNLEFLELTVFLIVIRTNYELFIFEILFKSQQFKIFVGIQLVGLISYLN